jgi:hypothetical protein
MHVNFPISHQDLETMWDVLRSLPMPLTQDSWFVDRRGDSGGEDVFPCIGSKSRVAHIVANGLRERGISEQHDARWRAAVQGVG